MWSYTDYTIYTAGCHSNPKYYHLLENKLLLCTRPRHEQVCPSLRRLKLNNKLNSQKTLFQLVQKALKNLKYMLYQIYYIIQVSVVYLINPAQLHPLLMAYLVWNVKLTTLENIYFKINFQVHYLKKINCSSKKKNIYITEWNKELPFRKTFCVLCKHHVAFHLILSTRHRTLDNVRGIFLSAWQMDSFLGWLNC